MQATMTIEFTPQDRADILTTAIESGHYAVHYWADVEQVSREKEDRSLAGLNPLSVRRLWLVEHDDEDRTVRTITCNTADLDAAASTVMRDHPNTDTAAQIRNSVATGDLDLDAEAADVLVQIALLGQIVYG